MLCVGGIDCKKYKPYENALINIISKKIGLARLGCGVCVLGFNVAEPDFLVLLLLFFAFELALEAEPGFFLSPGLRVVLGFAKSWVMCIATFLEVHRHQGVQVHS
jgi:hypothetical protein